jgi:putative SOS response-associated peptidase YedK
MMVERARWSAWLDPTVSGRDDVLALLEPAAPGRLEAFPVSTDVNNVRNNGASLVEPIPAEDALA